MASKQMLFDMDARTAMLAGVVGVAVDAVFDSVSVATTFREKLAEDGIIFVSDEAGVIQISQDKIDIPPTESIYGTSAIVGGKYICQINVTA